MTLPTYFARHGFVTAGVGKIFHPDACTRMHEGYEGVRFSHRLGDDFRAWNHGEYGVEGRLQRPFDNVGARLYILCVCVCVCPFWPVFC